MMKKRNVAMAMSAVTVASAVAPIFADTLEGSIISSKDTQSIENLKSEIKGFLDVKYSKTAELVEVPKNGLIPAYTPAAGSLVYDIKVTNANGIATTIKSVEDLEIALAKLNDKNNKFLNITVKDRGHNLVDGEMVNWKEGKFTKDEVLGLLSVVGNQSIEDTTKIDDNTVSLKLKNNEEQLVVKTDDAKFSISNPEFKKDSVGNYLDKDGNVIVGITSDVQANSSKDAVVIGFDKVKEELDRTNTQDSDIEDTRNYGVNFDETITKEFKVNELYESKIGRFTTIGNELVKYINEYDNNNNIVGSVEIGNITDSKLIISLPVDKTEVTRNASGKFAEIVITGSTNELKALKATLDTKTSSITTLAGTNRAKTAIEVSKSAFKTNNETGNNIVLVSSNAIADGLAATPFAKQEQAPVLLTGVDSISEETMDEIKRVIDKRNGKIYLIGGNSAIDAAVETQLRVAGFAKNKIVRIEGKDRQETSLKIAEKMTANMDEVFVTGGWAEADAMSIAAVAAKGGAKDTNANPILLSGSNGLSEEQVKFLNGKKADTYIIGGEVRVPTSVEEQVESAEMKGDTKRIAGDRRQETNAKVIKEFYSKATNIEALYVAKSDDNGLVDALAAGVAAAKENSPVLLATDTLDASQESVLKNLKFKYSAAKKQVGYGIATKVWENIKDIF